MTIIRIGPGEVGVFYVTKSRVLLHKTRHDPDDPVIEYTLRFGESGFVVPQSEPYHDDAARQMIAERTGAPVLDALDERCAVVENGVVIAAHQRDPEFYPLQPGERGTDLVAHRHADVGDIWHGGDSFTRRHFVVDKASGKIVGEGVTAITSAGSIVPAAPEGYIHFLSGTLKVGDIHEFPSHVRRLWPPPSS